MKPGHEIVENKVGSPYSKYSQLHLDKKGTLWMAFNWGLMNISLDKHGGALATETFETGLIRTLAEDSSGNLFFGNNAEILKLAWNRDQYRFITLPSDFDKAYTFNFKEDAFGNIWIGTFNGLLKYDPSNETFEGFKGDITDSKNIPHESIYGMLKDKDSFMWFATEKGVVKYDHNARIFLRVPHVEMSHHLFQDQEGLIWFLSRSKLYSLDPKNWKARSFEQITDINQMFIDRENVLWIVSKDGLQDYHIRQGELIARGDKVLSAQPGSRTLNEDNLGRLWITYGFGVYIVDKKTRNVVHFMNTNNSPLRVDEAYGIVRDKNGYIWLKQFPEGSICIDPKTFEAVAYLPYWIYGGPNKGSGRFGASVLAEGEDGKLYIDGHGVFGYFYPDSLRINKIPPKLALRHFKINGESSSGNGVFQSTENNAEIAFTALHFDDPNLNKYSFFLEGFDNEWSTPTSSREARYSSLPAGTFQFYLRAANSDGVWSEPKLLASFRILPVWWQTNLAYAVYVGLIVGLVVAFYRIRLSQKLAHAEAQKFKEIDDFKNQFFTNITHEFRTPLTVITGIAERVDGDRGLLIRRNADQLLTLINQILELSKVEANATRLNPETFEVINYLNYLLQSFASLAAEKSISLEFKSDHEKYELVLDKTKFTLIVQNLVTNAIKFTPDGGLITLQAQTKNGQLIIEVQDTGVGIRKEELPMIFNRFYQADNQQENWKGTGIGLALTRELVQLLNGSIDVESEVGKGSKFRVTLPVETAEIDKKSSPIPKDTIIEMENNEERLGILVIEDNPDVASLIKDILSESFEVALAMNGKVGVEKAIEGIPDLIVSDVMMPEMNGLEVTNTLKSDERTSHIPIILLTAKADLDSKLSGLEKGADVYLAKPFNSRELLLHIQNLIRLRDALRNRYSSDQLIESAGGHPEDQFIINVQSHVFERLSDENFGIDEICREVGVSRTQLHRKLKALTGKSASIFIRDLRLAEGRKRLLQNGATVSEIAYAVGFSDPNYFSRLYSEKYGHSPIQERKT
jgi:signal transduction histidine kinase/DNA-binding response OmpR family regulator/streptogramin lyase